VPKESKPPEDSNHLVIDIVNESQPETLSQSTTDPLPPNQTSTAEKTKKKKAKSKKRSEKTQDGVSTSEFDLADSQLPGVGAEETGGAGKQSKKIRREGQVVRSEDVDGYCGSLPVDDLIKFIDCSRKLWRHQSQTDAGSLTEVGKLQSMKKESARDAAVENDSGFGDVESADRTDASHSDGALSPSVSSVSESVEIVVELLSDSLNPAPSQSTTETKEESLIENVQDILSNATPDWAVDSDLSFAATFLSDEELTKPEPEFVVVRQKKRRTKSKQACAVSSDKSVCSAVGLMPSQNCSVVCSSASSERSNSPPSVAAVSEITANGRQIADTKGNASSFRRFNSEPKWRARHPRFNHTSSEVHPVNTRTHASGNTYGRRWLTTSGGKNREMGKIKDVKSNLSDGITHRRQLPDVVLNAERPRQADRPCISSPAKVLMQDAHCQTVDDTALQSPSIDTSQTHVPFDLLTLQLFMYHGK